MMRDTVTIMEYEASEPVPLGPADLAMIEALPRDRIVAQPTARLGVFTLRATSWVGAIELDSLRVRILPKVDDLQNVFMMFGAATGASEWSPRSAGYAPEELVEGIAELLLRTIDGATRRGLVHGYRVKEERLPTLRGRLQIAKIASRPWDLLPIPSLFDDFTGDVPENRVLRAAVSQVRRWLVSPQARRLAAELDNRFIDVGLPADALLEADLVRESPLNEHYRPALALARFVLESLGVSHTGGRVEAASFLVDMNLLYEQWIGAELFARLWPEIDVAEQDNVLLSRRPSVPMRPDLVFRTRGRPVLVGDVKYKLTATGVARNADYYQLLAYATALELPRGILVYCQAAEALEREIVVNGGGQRLTVVPLGLGGTWEQISTRLDRLARSVLALSIDST